MSSRAYIEEQLEILRRNCDRGLDKSWKENNTMFVDLFQHMKDEIERAKKALYE